jgi:hypothetical protein
MSEQLSKVDLTTIGHDPNRGWVKWLPKASEVLGSIYNNRLIIFTPQTHEYTKKAAQDSGWQVIVEDNACNPINGARWSALKKGLDLEGDYLVLADADRAIRAAIVDPDGLLKVAQKTQQFDFVIVGGSKEAVKSHPRSIRIVEEKKSAVVSNILDINGDDIGNNRGFFGFSKDFTKLLVTNPFREDDETDTFFPIMAKALGASIGYIECDRLAGYERPFYQGLSPELGALVNSTYADYQKRRKHVLRAIRTAYRIANSYNLRY